MSATILDGRAQAREMQAEIEQQVKDFVAGHGVAPSMAVVRAGEDEASVSYARTILNTMEKRGLKAAAYVLPADVALQELVDLVARLSADPAVHGIMIQEPYPKGIDPGAVIAALDPAKDVDGVHPQNAGRLAQAEPLGRGAPEARFFVPATPAGGMELMRRYGIQFGGKHAVVVGRSNIVGKPMALLLLRENATVTICHSRTADLAAICRQGDIVAAAVGRARMIRGDWIKPGAVVVDFGVNFVEGAMCGDVDYAEAAEVAGWITPVPGGTGPMTNVMLMRNLLAAAGGG